VQRLAERERERERQRERRVSPSKMGGSLAHDRFINLRCSVLAASLPFLSRGMRKYRERERERERNRITNKRVIAFRASRASSRTAAMKSR